MTSRSPIAQTTMNAPGKNLIGDLKEQLSNLEASLTRKENVLSFLIIRFVLMSGMVIAFSWTFLQHSP
ncbi:MAG: hypothetical protein VKP63_08280 [Cyanobacteriota bacterium]|nr:hypothetical protein [Cyanobacteriota bacterium]